jgi:tRNA (cytidine/uridine-2'-O-)-methyltransferase
MRIALYEPDIPQNTGTILRLAACLGLSAHIIEQARVRLVLFTTAAATSYLDHTFRDDDLLLFGRESAGVPESVHRAAQARLVIPMRPGLRSLNVAMAAAMAVGEALRQTGGFPARAAPGPVQEPA